MNSLIGLDKNLHVKFLAAPQTQTTSRFDQWLESTTIGDDPEAPGENLEVSEKLEKERLEKAEEIINRNKEDENENIEEVADQVAELEVKDKLDRFDLASMSQMSKLSTTSCSPAEIKRQSFTN